jgi:hypothetical protein
MLVEERQARQGKQDGDDKPRLFAKIASPTSDAATRSHRHGVWRATPRKAPTRKNDEEDLQAVLNLKAP